MHLPDRSSRAEPGGKCTFSFTDHTLAWPAEKGHFKSNQSVLCAPLLSLLCTFIMSRFTLWYPPSLHAQPLFLLPGLDEHQVRGRNLRRGRSLSSVHICRPAVHMFTPDPSPADVWAAPARSSLCIASMRRPPQHPPQKVLLPTVEEKPPQPPSLKWATVQLGVSPRPRKNQRAELRRTLWVKGD